MSGIDFSNLFFGNFDVRDVKELDGVDNNVFGSSLKDEIDGILESTDSDLNTDREKRDALADLFGKVEDENLDEALGYLKQENSSLASDVLGRLDLDARREETQAWADVSSVATSIEIDDNKDSIQDSINDIEGGELDNATVSKIYEQMRTDGATKAEALRDVKELLSNEGLDNVDDIESIKETSSSDDNDLESVKEGYIAELNEGGALHDDIEKALESGELDPGDPVRSDRIAKMEDDILATKPSNSEMTDEEYVSRAIEDIVQSSDKFADDTEVRATRYYEKTQVESDAEVLNSDGESVGSLEKDDYLINAYDGDNRIEDVYVTDSGDIVEKRSDGDYDLLEPDEEGYITTSDGTRIHRSDIEGKDEYQIHIGEKEEEAEVEAGAKDAFRLFVHDSADTAEAQGDEDGANRAREAADSDMSMKDIFGMIMGIVALVGGVIASSSGQSHRTYGQPSYNPYAGAYSPGGIGPLRTPQPQGIQVNQASLYAENFRGRGGNNIFARFGQYRNVDPQYGIG